MSVFILLRGLSFSVVAAASIKLPEGGGWQTITGAKGKAYDSQANTIISYGTTGVVLSPNYGLTIGVYKKDGYALSTKNSFTVGKEVYANWYTNIAAGHIAHYHQLFAAYASRQND